MTAGPPGPLVAVPLGPRARGRSRTSGDGCVVPCWSSMEGGRAMAASTVVLLAASLASGTGSAAGTGSAPGYELEVVEVQVPAVVQRDRRYVRGLEARDFQVLESGQEVEVS